MLDYRTEQLNAIRQRVAQEEAKRVAIIKKIEAYDQSIQQQIHEQQNTVQASPQIDPARMQAFPDYIWRLRQQRFFLTHQLAKQEESMRTIQQELKQAMIKTKTLETLKDKAHRRYLKDIEKAEEAMLAEIALNSHNARQKLS